MGYQIKPQKIRRIKFLDKIFERLISLGGILIILSVLGILVMIMKVALPLFYEPQLQLVQEFDLPEGEDIAYLSSDDYYTNFFALNQNFEGYFYRADDKENRKAASLPEWDGTKTPLSIDTFGDNHFSVLTETGSVYLYKIDYIVSFEGDQRRIDPEILLYDQFEVKNFRRDAFQSFQARIDEENEETVTAISYKDDSLNLVIRSESSSLLSDEDEKEESEYSISHQFQGAPSIFRLSSDGSKIWLGSPRGDVEFWKVESGEDPELILSERPIIGKITSMQFLYGDESIGIGDDNGQLTIAGYYQDSDSKTGFALSNLHEFQIKNDHIQKSFPLLKNKTLISLTERGNIYFHYSTSERELVRLSGDKTYTNFALNERGNTLIALTDENRLEVFYADISHPEFSISALFGRVFYEGYSEPTWTWQSSSGSDDFEPKYSFVPLIFGSLKGTLFAMIFAVPISIVAALYTSQFSNPIWRQWIKPSVEIMAAFPSVVIGFLAGLWLAPLLETHLTTLLVALVSAPFFFAFVFYLCRKTKLIHRRFYLGNEFLWGMIFIGLWIFLSSKVAPGVEQTLFGGNLTQWLFESLGTVYDQRNSIVISFALGFAVIPIIFTISEDAISNVPGQLSAGSLALGATRWQTACRLIIPSASPGIFVATIVGFGRAVGETMIVLMATGNTPLLDWSIFNGMRTLAANIAVEIPEAPVNGTLYRILFLSATLLFLLTFVLNAIAEVVRLKLRNRYGKL